MKKCTSLDLCSLRSKGAEILAADGSTILKVASDPEQHTARGTVILEAQEAKLQVTTDHRVVLATGDLATLLQFMLQFVEPLEQQSSHIHNL